VKNGKSGSLIKQGMRYILLLLVLVSTHLYAGEEGKKIKLKNIKAYAVGAENQSPAEVKQMALNEAKLQALQKAGVTEQITAYSDFLTKENNNQIEEIFNSNVLNDLQGVVQDVELLSEEKKINDRGLLEIHIVANITVLKFKSGMDPSFDVWVDGVKPSYNNGDKLTFDYKPNKKAYLRAFIITESNEAFQLYPNDYEGNFEMNEKETYTFPRASLDYELTAELKKEAHRLILVSLKSDIPYNREVSYKALMDWVFQIPPDQRRITTFTFDVFPAKP
tara:strand:- start:27998 stop:28831 length:834 start_codon:yes stop_codon:yes gene_type:complete